MSLTYTFDEQSISIFALGGHYDMLRKEERRAPYLFPISPCSLGALPS